MSNLTYKPVPSVLRMPRRARTLASYIGLTPAHALAARRQAERQQASGAFEDALKNWMLALTIDPDTPHGWRGLAGCLHALERRDDAARIEGIASKRNLGRLS